MNQRTMRLIGSPPEALGVEPLGRDTGCLGGPADLLGPLLRAADIDVPLGDVGHPPAQGGEVVGGADPVAEPGSRRAAATGQPQQLEPALLYEDLELPPEQGRVGEAVEQDGVTRRVVEFLGERPQRGDADAGRDESDLPLRPRPGAEPSVRSLDEHGGAAAQAAQRRGSVALLLDGDPQAEAVGRGGEGVRVDPCPPRAAQEPPAEEMPRPRPPPGPPGTPQPKNSPASARSRSSRRPVMYTDTTPSPSGTTEVTLRRCRALRHNGRPIRQISTAAAAAAQRPHQNTVAAVEARNCCPVHSWWGNARPTPRYAYRCSRCHDS